MKNSILVTPSVKKDFDSIQIVLSSLKRKRLNQSQTLSEIMRIAKEEIDGRFSE